MTGRNFGDWIFLVCHSNQLKLRIPNVYLMSTQLMTADSTLSKSPLYTNPSIHDETPLLSPPVEFNHWNKLSSSDLAMARSLPPEAAIPAYPAQNETCCRSAQHRISALAIGPRIAEKGWRPVWCGEGTYGD